MYDVMRDVFRRIVENCECFCSINELQRWQAVVQLYIVVRRFKRPSTQRWLFFNSSHKGRHSTVSDRFQEPILIVLYIFLFLSPTVLSVMQIHSVVPPKKKKTELADGQ